VIGHRFFEEEVDSKLVEPSLEGVCSAVIGLLLLTAFQFVRVSSATVWMRCVLLLVLRGYPLHG
jgi:hypothetical protein